MRWKLNYTNVESHKIEIGLIKKITIYSLFIFLPLSSFASHGRHHHNKHHRSACKENISLADEGIVIPQPSFNPCGKYSSHPVIDSLLSFAFLNLNKPYRSGSTGPYSFDCSGFTRYVYGHFGYDLDHNSGSQSNYGEVVSKDDLRPGDLVFFKGRNARASRIGHVGIVSSVNEDGSFTFIHSANGTGISNDNSTGPYYTRRYVTARRIIPQDNDENSIPEFLRKPVPVQKPKPAENILIVPENEESAEIENNENANAALSSITVERGQSLYSIAKQYHCTAKQLKEWNKLKSNRLKIGQELKVSAPEEALAENNDGANTDNVSTETSSTKGRILIHHVRKGENLYVIAQKYGCTANDLRKWNNLSTASVRPNQKLYIGQKRGSSAPVYYVVKKGETLNIVAEKNQTSVSKLKKLNHLSSTKINEGNYLQIQ